MKRILAVIALIFLTGCSTFFNEKTISSQSEAVEAGSSISIGSIEVTDKNNLPLNAEKVKTFVSLISSKTDFALNRGDQSDFYLNISIKESSYIQELETENSVVVNFSLIRRSDKKTAYHGVLIKNSETPLISDNLLFDVLESSYELLVDTLNETISNNE